MANENKAVLDWMRGGRNGGSGVERFPPPFLLGKHKLLKNAAAFTSAVLAKLLRRRTYSTEKAFMRRGMLYWICSKSSGETEINDVPFSPFAFRGNARPTVFSSFFCPLTPFTSARAFHFCSTRRPLFRTYVRLRYVYVRRYERGGRKVCYRIYSVRVTGCRRRRSRPRL